MDPRRIAIYARYSSDLQSPSSVDDQVALCRKLIAGQLGGDPRSALVFSDASITGEVLTRPGLVRLMAAAEERRIGMVVAEGLDRISRTLKHVASIYDTLSYHDVILWTGHEGKITELHIGLKGTMNALQLKDMKEKVRRGQRGRVEAGYASTSSPYGYRVVRGIVDDKGRNVNGVREIDEEQAEVVRRIFTEYADGRTLQEIVADLNRDGIPSPGGSLWRPTALVGARREGVLLNEAYLGLLIYGRTRCVRDPQGRKRNVETPEETWTRQSVPELRIVDDPLWERVQARYRQILALRQIRGEKRKESKEPRILTSHNQHALTGWVKCGVCGGLKSLANHGRYICSTNRYAKACPSSRGTKEPILLAETFKALKYRVHGGTDFRPALLKAFDKQLKIDKALTAKEAAIKAKIDRLVGLIVDGVDVEHTTARLLALQGQLNKVRLKMSTNPAPTLPSEQDIRTALREVLDDLEASNDVKRQRVAFQHLLGEIVLTPIEHQRSGETMTITLREEGWPEFWRMIAG